MSPLLTILAVVAVVVGGAALFLYVAAWTISLYEWSRRQQ